MDLDSPTVSSTDLPRRALVCLGALGWDRWVSKSGERYTDPELGDFPDLADLLAYWRHYHPTARIIDFIEVDFGT